MSFGRSQVFTLILKILKVISFCVAQTVSFMKFCHIFSLDLSNSVLHSWWNKHKERKVIFHNLFSFLVQITLFSNMNMKSIKTKSHNLWIDGNLVTLLIDWIGSIGIVWKLDNIASLAVNEGEWGFFFDALTLQIIIGQFCDKSFQKH